MKLYTKQGDCGCTMLLNEKQVSKCDNRIELLGTLDELSSHIGLAKVVATQEMRSRLSEVQNELFQMMAAVADNENVKYAFSEEQISRLEMTIDYLENSFPREKRLVMCGDCELSARLDVARTVARRAERRYWLVDKTHDTDACALRYLNRLSDYLYIEARFADNLDSQ